MKKFISTVSAAALLGLSALVGLMPAAAAGPMRPSYQQQDRYIGNYCDGNPGAAQCVNSLPIATPFSLPIATP